MYFSFLDAPIYFANTQNIQDKVQKYEYRASQEKGIPVQFVIIEFSAVAHVDTSGLHTLHEMHKNFHNRNIRLCVTNPNAKVMQRLLSSGLVDEIGREQIFVSTHDAVSYCLNEMDFDEMTKNTTDMRIEETFPLKLNAKEHSSEPVSLGNDPIDDPSEMLDIEEAPVKN